MPAIVDQPRSALGSTANQLTILRIVLVPVFISLLVSNELGWALTVFVVAGLTDTLDGLIARKFGQKTSLGGFLDPIADKLLMTSSFLILALPQMELPNTIPRWLTVTVIFRDVFILLVSLVVVLMAGFRLFQPSVFGKACTVFQIVTILAVLFSNWRGTAVPDLRWLFYGTWGITVFSGLHYLSRSLRSANGK